MWCKERVQFHSFTCENIHFFQFAEKTALSPLNGLSEPLSKINYFCLSTPLVYMLVLFYFKTYIVFSNLLLILASSTPSKRRRMRRKSLNLKGI